MGEPGVQRAAARRARPAVGIDIGGTKLLGVRLGGGGVVEAEVRAATPTDGPDVVERILEVTAELAGTNPSAIGVGIPGLVDSDGMLRFSPHLPGLVGAPVARRLLAEHPGARLWVGNDATAAAWAEYVLGAGRGVTDMVMVTIGTGIGGGIVSGGRLVEGTHRFAGELGHMVVDPHGPPCPCGKRGCWERRASGSGLAALGREAAIAGQAPGVASLAGDDPEAVRGEHVTAAASAGDPDAVAIMERFAWWVGLGLANLANILDPEVIVLGGGLVDSGEVLVSPVRRAFAELVEAPDERAPWAVLAAELGSRAGAVGAGLLAVRARQRRPARPVGQSPGRSRSVR
jgi:glucokinase